VDPLPHRRHRGRGRGRAGARDPPRLRRAHEHPEVARHLHDRAHRRLQGQHPRPAPTRPRGHRHANGPAVDRQRAARVGRSLPRGGLGLQHRDRPRGGAAGVRRGPVRLRALPDRRAPRRGAVFEAEHQGDATARHRRVPRARAPRARRDGRLRRRGRLRLHGVQRERHGHRPARRGADAPPRLHLADGLPVGLPPRDPGLQEPRRAPLRGRVRERAAHPEARDPHPGAGAAVAAGLPRLRVRSPHVRREILEQIRGADDGGAAGWMLWNPRNDYTGAALQPKEALAAK